jgi:S-adenosylmethionine:tRNA ribosyltransferase-isomerase
VLHRESETIEHRTFRDFPGFIAPGELVVLNDTRVLAARRFSDDGAVEFLFLENVAASRWKCLVKPGRKMRAGASFTVGGVALRVEEVLPQGERIVSFDSDIDVYADGAMPLPPYLDRPSDEEDVARYQTVFAQSSGAVAAPTAGLHFTTEMLRQIPHAFVTLHVGPGTFRPVKTDDIANHRMHAERFSISGEAAGKINGADRIVAVGTTTVRTLESAAGKLDPSKPARSGPETSNTSSGPLQTRPKYSVEFQKRRVQPGEGETDIFIYPPFQFRVVDALLTNFHLPKSTLLMLVSAFAGREFILRAYAEAIRDKYRFYSYGDCMLIL